jgi:transketolase
VVSLPSWELFAAAPCSEQARVLRPDLPSLAVEAGSTMGWSRWTDEAVGIDRFGASAPGAVVMEQLGISAANVADRARALLAGAVRRAAR